MPLRKTHALTTAILAATAGTVLAVSGCTAPFDERADVVDPVTGQAPQPVNTEPSYNENQVVRAAFTRSPDAPTAFSAPTPGRPANNGQYGNGQLATTPTATDNWVMVAATNAEVVNAQAESQRVQPSNDTVAFGAFQNPDDPIAIPFGSAPTGPGIAARLYNDILNTEIPEGGRPIGTHTANIQQMTFASDGSDFDPSVSRDGLTLVYASTQHRPEADIYAQRIGSRVITRLTDDPAADVMPSVSVDGQRIAYASNRAGNWDIWVMPSTGGRSLQITTDPAPELSPSFSPDGQHVVYCRLGTTSGRWEIWIADAFGDAGDQFIGYGLFPEWCPVPGTGHEGADRIVFQRSRERGSRTFSIWTIDYDRSRGSAGRETQIVSDPSFALINPTWSPDGARVTYSSVPNPERWTGVGQGALPPAASIQMIGVDGRGQVSLTSGNSIDMMPAWGATGRVFFVSNRSGVENLWAIDIAEAIQAATGEDPWNDVASMGRGEPASFGVPPFGPGLNSFVSAPTEP